MKYAHIENKKVVNILEASPEFVAKDKRDLRPFQSDLHYLIGDTILASGAVKERPTPKAPTKTAKQLAREAAIKRLQTSIDPDIVDLLTVMGLSE